MLYPLYQKSILLTFSSLPLLFYLDSHRRQNVRSLYIIPIASSNHSLAAS